MVWLVRGVIAVQLALMAGATIYVFATGSIVASVSVLVAVLLLVYSSRGCDS